MANKVEILGRNMDVTDRINNYVEKKVAKLDRFLNTIDETRIELSHVKSARSAADRHVAQITVRGKGFILRTEERADDIFSAFDSGIDKMVRQIERYKGKHYRGRGDGKTAADVVPIEVEAEQEQNEIVRRKRFELLPMDEIEAIEQMKLLGHDNFFIFFNAKENAINVLYRRRDGTYGLIEPNIR